VIAGHNVAVLIGEYNSEKIAFIVWIAVEQPIGIRARDEPGGACAHEEQVDGNCGPGRL
jgi:hypothetical protein